MQLRQSAAVESLLQSAGLISAAVCSCGLQLITKKYPVETSLLTMATDPAPYQHRNLSQFIPDNHNIGLTNEQLVTISTKEFNRRLKNSGKLSGLSERRDVPLCCQDDPERIGRS